MRQGELQPLRLPRTYHFGEMNFEQTIEILAAFQREQVRYVLIGSMAMAAHGLIRATQDADFLVAADYDNVERIKRALDSVFHDPHIDEITSADLSGSYPVIRYGPPASDFVIDFISRLGEAFVFHEVEWDEVSIEGDRASGNA